MPRSKKNDEAEVIVTSLGSEVPLPENVIVKAPERQDAKSILTGKEISINLKNGTYFGVGPIWLTANNYWCEIPENLSSEEYEIIAKSLKIGTIVLGKNYIPPIEKASNVLDKYWLMIERNGLDAKSTRTEFSMLIKRGTDSGWTALEIVQHCLQKEQAGKRRKDVIRLLEQVVKNYDGPVSLYDPPDEAQGIKKVSIGPDGSIKITTNSGEEVAKPVAEPAPPENHLRGNKSASQAVNDLFA